MTTEAISGLLRRNGKPQSCEPCRKSKLKCDHAQPLCGRCVQRKIQHRCVYHPAPMTQENRPSRSSHLVQRQDVPAQDLSCVRADPHKVLPASDIQTTSGDRPTNGYLDPTSRPAILCGNDSGLSGEDFTHQTTRTIFQEYDIAKPSPFEPCDLATCDLEAQSHVDQGVRVLKRLPDIQLCQRLIDRYFETCDVLLPEHVIRHVHISTWSRYGQYLSNPESVRSERLAVMSKMLCKTAMTPLSSSSNTQEWLDSFSGDNLRWEILGNIFAILGLSAMTISDWDPLFASVNSDNASKKRQYGAALRECAEDCLALCNDIDAANDFVVSLMSAIHTIQCYYEGYAGGF